MSRWAGRSRAIGPLVSHVLAVALGGVLVWYCFSTSTTEQDTSQPDPLRTRVVDYDWTEYPAPEFPLPPHARFLDGVRIVLDPGHGGRGDRKGWKRGPTGLREAEVNLRVARMLREFLAAAGADVRMTRESDVFLDEDPQADLRKRIELANRLVADVFLSIHHNAADTPKANYTTVFYHAAPDHSPASLDVGRHLLDGLNNALRLEHQLECGLVSDFALHPETGFAVLRQARVPAVLCESSFHSNPEEERRLRDPTYNRREAYGLFLGLARWARGGLPRIRLIAPANGRATPGRPIVVGFEDGLSDRQGLGLELPQLRTGTLRVEVSGAAVPYEVDLAKRQLRIATTEESLAPGSRLRVDFANVFGQHVLHPWVELEVARGGN